MPDKLKFEQFLLQTETYLCDTLLPFWIEHSLDVEAGGFLTYFDSKGQPTGETTKTFLMQARMLYTMSSAHRAGYGNGRCAELAGIGADFLLEHYWDKSHKGWIWIADRFGKPTNMNKVGYGQCFGMYAFSEYYLATGDERGKEAAERTYSVVAERMTDVPCGGYFEIMQRDWTPQAGGKTESGRKSMDVHMHMMEALTNLYEMSGFPIHRQDLTKVIDLIISKMLRSKDGTGYLQFTRDFTPVPAIEFDVKWGRDEEVEKGITKSLNYTSYGHNVEFAWLLLYAAEILSFRRSAYVEVLRKVCDSCIEFGIDKEYGGVYIEGPNHGPPQNLHKQFWQQAEVLIGMLEAYHTFADEKYWDAFENVYNFVMTKFVNKEGGGEWYALLDRDGSPIWDYQGDEWKINYHTVRSMIQMGIIVQSNNST